MHIYSPPVCMLPTEARSGHLIPETGLKSSCQPPCGCCELNPGSLEEWPVLFATGLSL